MYATYSVFRRSLDGSSCTGCDGPVLFRKVVLIQCCATLQNVKAAHKVALLKVKQYHR